MNILFLPHRLPFPPTKGDKIRSYHLLKHLLENHTVYLGTFIDNPSDWKFAPEVEKMVGGRCFIAPLTGGRRNWRAARAIVTGESITASSFRDNDLARWVGDLLSSCKVDRVIAFSSAMAPYVLDARSNCSHAILDMVDVDSDKWWQFSTTARGVKAWLYKREAAALQRLERQAVQAFFATLLVSEFEAETLREDAPTARDRILSSPNGVDLSFYSDRTKGNNPFQSAEHPIVMTGQMDYLPNWEGALWFAEQVLPLILRSCPTAKFYVVGANPPLRLRRLASGNLIVTGEVPDTRPYLGHAAVAVAPLQKARGIQNKVLEAMAMGRAVVATSMAARSLQVRSGGELLIADRAEAFAAAVCATMDPKTARDLGQRARAHVEAFYNWKQNLAVIDALLQGRSPAEILSRKAALGNFEVPVDASSEPSWA